MTSLYDLTPGTRVVVVVETHLMGFTGEVLATPATGFDVAVLLDANCGYGAMGFDADELAVEK